MHTLAWWSGLSEAVALWPAQPGRSPALLYYKRIGLTVWWLISPLPPSCRACVCLHVEKMDRPARPCQVLSNIKTCVDETWWRRFQTPEMNMIGYRRGCKVSSRIPELSESRLCSCVSPYSLFKLKPTLSWRLTLLLCALYVSWLQELLVVCISHLDNYFQIRLVWAGHAVRDTSKECSSQSCKEAQTPDKFGFVNGKQTLSGLLKCLSSWHNGVKAEVNGVLADGEKIRCEFHGKK